MNNDRVELLTDFKNVAAEQDGYIIPEVPEKRHRTDEKFIITFVSALVVLAGFLIYAGTQSNTNRIIHGYDPSGNVCGEKNPVSFGVEGSGIDMTDKPYLEIQTRKDINNWSLLPRQCVKSCDPKIYNVFFYFCYSKSANDPDTTKSASELLKEIGQDIKKSVPQIFGIVVVALCMCIALLLLFRYAVHYAIWGVLSVSIIGLGVLCGYFWCLYLNNPIDKRSTVYQILGVCLTVFVACFIIILLCMFKRIQVIKFIFEEAMKAAFSMPAIFLEPVLTFLALFGTIASFVYVTFVIASAGSLQLLQMNTYGEGAYYGYPMSSIIIFTICFNLVIALWMIHFIIGCQHMVLSGAISAWYFARDKSTLARPIYHSFYNLLVYHIGTVCFGSLVLTIVTVIRLYIRSLLRRGILRYIIYCCLIRLEAFLRYLTKNAYIQTAMHGQSFFKSGKRAANLLCANILNVIALNSVGDFVLAMTKVVVLVAAVGAGVLMRPDDTDVKNYYAAVFIGVIIAAFLADCFFVVFETAIDTIFLCYCEDSMINDGMTKPFFMSVNLAKFVEDSKLIAPNKKLQT